MIGKNEAFINIDSSFGSKVKLGNGENVEVKGKGSIGVTTKQGSKVIHDTLYVSELDENLLSIGQLLEHGYSLNFDNRYVFNLGAQAIVIVIGSEGVISWCSKKQDTVAQSSVEAKYLAAGLATQHSLWLRRILDDIGEKQEGSLQLHCDKKSAIDMAKNHVYTYMKAHQTT
ncbi:hypothetical protein KIW84_076402 [Lathyrus oleraceus]|uniref:Retrovirus-related Pol polyprotein from transposon TNT 1-94-like beta-barrel domain-containing protein n=1 Tax=Pisum sativum TaxID=3888 RepID=A0A9D4VXY7_PEA|nr:hypothetical protein KIW84_076402 [Pisum sativum]